MDRTISATVAASAPRAMEALADLTTYPEWLGLVNSVEAESSASGSSAWLVTLRARLGPLARSKRLRMVRTHLDDRSVRFERDELGDRQHAEWVLSAQVTPVGESSTDVRVHLHYSGALWSAPLEIVLSSFEGSAADRLSGYLADHDS